MSCRRVAAAALAALAAAAPLRAQDDAVLPLRVTSVLADGKVVVDRGARDLLQMGDRIELQLTDGQKRHGNVVRIDERSALVELFGRGAAPRAGTRGEVRIPRARQAARPRPPTPAPRLPEPEPPERSKWPARDDGWQPGMPLLSGVQPLRPEERPPAARGRAFLIAGFTGTTIGDAFDPLLRAGVELDAANLGGFGGELHLDAEFDVRTDALEETDTDLLVRGLSWHRGGTRFDRDRYEVGRFLHHVIPELGYLDGAEWTRRLEGGSRIGASFGWMPLPNADFESFDDLQFSVYGEWLADPDGVTRLGVAAQKTWHDGHGDRDAIVLVLHQAPIDGWQVHGNAWIDFYFGGDDIKGPGVQLTSGYLSVGRDFDDGGFDLTYRRIAYPDIDRPEFPPLPPDELADERYDRLVLDTWTSLSEEGDRAHATLSGFDDEERLGGAAELGLLLQNRLGDETALDLVAFGGRAQFERFIGGRASWSGFTTRGHVQLLYEFGWHRLDDRPPDGDDLFQQRLAVALDYRTESGWMLGASADAIYWDAEFGWTVMLTMSRNF